MKRQMFILILLAFITITYLTPKASASLGDLNNDTKVDTLDLLIIIKYIIGIDQTNNAVDVNGDGTVNIFDLVSTAKFFGTQYGTDTTPPSIINSTPSNNTLLASGTTQQAIFIETNEVATCKYANFSSGNFTVNMTNFTKTGGIAHTVTVTGLQSGNSYYYIKCQDASGNLNNTNYIINISVNSSTTNSSYNANEPAGLTLVNQRPFDTKLEDSWYLEYPPDSDFTIVNDSTAPVSPSNVGQALYPQGFGAGSGPIDTEIDLSGDTQFYMSFPVKFSSNFYGCGTNKIFFIWIAGQPGIYLKANGDGSGPLTFEISTQSSASSEDPLAIGNTITRNQWVNIEIYMKTNTGSNANGIVKIWQDGSLVVNLSNVEFVTSSDSHTWERVAWNPTWGGGCSGTVPSDQYMWIDNVYISGAA